VLEPPPGGLQALRRRLAGEPRRRAIRLAWDAALASIAAGAVVVAALLRGNAVPPAPAWPPGEHAMVPPESRGQVALSAEPVRVPGAALYWVAGMARVDPSPLPEMPAGPG
jgi:hypothetical protein